MKPVSRLIVFLILMVWPVLATADMTIKKGYVSKRAATAGVLLYLHDCWEPKLKEKTGLLKEWFRHFERSGLKVYAPNSFAEERPGSACGYNKHVKIQLRKKRIEQTLNTLEVIEKKHPNKPVYIWADGEGARVAMRLAGTFAGVVTTGHVCGADRWNKVFLSHDTPLMMMLGDPKQDKYLRQRLSWQKQKEVWEGCDSSLQSGLWQWQAFDHLGHHFPSWDESVREAAGKVIPMNEEYNSFTPDDPEVGLTKIRAPTSKKFRRFFSGKYRDYSSAKAVAIGPRNVWGYSWSYTSEADAKMMANYHCSLFLKKKGRRDRTCTLYAVNERIVHANLSRPLIKRVQQALAEEGYDPGPIDGAWGNKSRVALNAFLETVGLRVRENIDMEVLEALDLAE
jgi:hypothetical protein